MLGKMLKWAARVLGSLAVLLLIGYGYISYDLQKKLRKTYQVAVQPIQVPDDPVVLARGKHLVAIRGCTECHGNDMAGKVMMENPALGKLIAPNLTRGKGGLPNDFTTTDWIKAIGHGLRKDNTSLTIMPSKEYTQLTEQDMAAIIAYCRHLPPVDNQLPEIELGPVLRLVNYTGKVNLLSAEDIDHELKLLPGVNTSISVEHGQYLAAMCASCHKPDFKGGPSVMPGFRAAPDLTSSGLTGKITEAQFKKTLRTGISHDGHQIDNKDMPWQVTTNFTEEELSSLYKYLQSLP